MNARERLVESGVRPFPEISTLEEDLRCIDERRALQLREPALALRELALRVRILPADVVPVIDVERERHDDFGTVPGAERREPAIGGRAAVASFGRVELDERGRLLAGAGAAFLGLRGTGKEDRKSGK